MRFVNHRPLTLVLFLIMMIIILSSGCNDSTDPTEGGVTVSLFDTGLNDGKLALNATASFTATVAGFAGDPSGLHYRWSLATDRGEFSDGTDPLPNPTLGGGSILCVGQTGGEERVSVTVLDAMNEILASSFYDFTIVPAEDPDGGLGCFDQPKIYFLNMAGSGYTCNFDGSGESSSGVQGSIAYAISPDGEWIASNETDLGGYQMYVTRCDGSTGWTWIEEGGVGEDFVPHFSADSRTLFFLRPEPSQEPEFNAFRLSDIAAYDLETGEVRFVTTLYQFGEKVGWFTVSPVTGEIAFYRVSYEELPDGTLRTTTKLSFVDPETGVIRDFTTLDIGVGIFGMDWSPDGENIIMAAQFGRGGGIFRLNLTEGSQPLRIYPENGANIVTPRKPFYYEGGERIVWGGQENGATNLDLWTIDANGNDKRQLLDFNDNILLMGVLE